MGDYQHSVDVGAPAGQLFGYLSDVRNLDVTGDTTASSVTVFRLPSDTQAPQRRNRRWGPVSAGRRLRCPQGAADGRKPITWLRSGRR
jgi:hypothetical protein